MIWTAIVGGGLVIVKWHGWSDELLYNLGLVHLLCGYIVLVSGILGLIQEGFSKDVRLPTVLHGGLLGTILLSAVLTRIGLGPITGAIMLLAIMWGLGYVILLWTACLERIKNREFSLAIFIYQFGSWGLWVMFLLVGILIAIFRL